MTIAIIWEQRTPHVLVAKIGAVDVGLVQLAFTMRTPRSDGKNTFVRIFLPSIPIYERWMKSEAVELWFQRTGVI